MSRSRVVLVALASLIVGVIAGGNLFSKSQPRSVISLRRCERCLSAADLAGLMASVAIQKAPGAMPLVVVETDRTIAFQLPRSSGFHFVIVPKKDLKDIGDISEANAAYLTDAYLVARHLIEKHKLSKYSFSTNGPGYQSVTYLHFHLRSEGV
jgi:scavenger mRNA decapping enzyme DcpS-like protein